MIIFWHCRILTIENWELFSVLHDLRVSMGHVFALINWPNQILYCVDMLSNLIEDIATRVLLHVNWPWGLYVIFLHTIFFMLLTTEFFGCIHRFDELWIFVPWLSSQVNRAWKGKIRKMYTQFVARICALSNVHLPPTIHILQSLCWADHLVEVILGLSGVEYRMIEILDLLGGLAEGL